MFVFITIHQVFSNKLCVYDDEKFKYQSNILKNKIMQEAPHSNNYTER